MEAGSSPMLSATLPSLLLLHYNLGCRKWGNTVMERVMLLVCPVGNTEKLELLLFYDSSMYLFYILGRKNKINFRVLRANLLETGLCFYMTNAFHSGA